MNDSDFSPKRHHYIALANKISIQYIQKLGKNLTSNAKVAQYLDQYICLIESYATSFLPCSFITYRISGIFHCGIGRSRIYMPIDKHVHNTPNSIYLADFPPKRHHYVALADKFQFNLSKNWVKISYPTPKLFNILTNRFI